MKSAVIPVTNFEQNCSIHWCEETRLAAAVDVGGGVDQIDDFLEQQGLKLEKVLLTHGHLDHASAAATLARTHGVPIEGPHPDDLFLIERLPEQAQTYGFPPSTGFRPDRWLHQGDVVHVGKESFEVRHCPGHTPGHVVFYNARQGLVIVGDVLFRGSIGRTDFPRGDYDTLIRSIETQLFSLPEQTVVLPGHGPLTTIGAEMRSNPYVGMAA